MDRYSDNVSPTPTIDPTAAATVNSTIPANTFNSHFLTSCFKTPDAYQTFQPYAAHLSQFYPTPPSDNENDSNIASPQYQLTPYSSHMVASLSTPLSASTNININHHRKYS